MAKTVNGYWSKHIVPAWFYLLYSFFFFPAITTENSNYKSTLSNSNLSLKLINILHETTLLQFSQHTTSWKRYFHSSVTTIIYCRFFFFFFVTKEYVNWPIQEKQFIIYTLIRKVAIGKMCMWRAERKYYILLVYTLKDSLLRYTPIFFFFPVFLIINTSTEHGQMRWGQGKQVTIIYFVFKWGRKIIEDRKWIMAIEWKDNILSQKLKPI